MTSTRHHPLVLGDVRNNWTGLMLRLGAVAITCVGISSAAHATALTATDYFLQYYNVGPNNLDFTSGQAIRYGATSVIPNPANPNAPIGGTTGTATTINAATGLTINRNIGFTTSAATPNFASGQITLCGQATTSACTPTGNNNLANLTNPFNITFSNPATTPTSVSSTLSLVGTGELPFVNTVTLSGTTAAPTFSWTPPPGVTIEGYRVNIYQNNLEVITNGSVVNSGQVTSRSFASNANIPGIVACSASACSYTVTSADFTHGVALSPNTQYTIEISALQSKDGTSNNLNLNNNVGAISRVYSNFEISSTSQPVIQLPTITVDKNGQTQYSFSFTVEQGVSYNIDPAVATGYIYQIGNGNPNFASVELPDIGNPNLYQLYLFNGSTFVFDSLLAPDTVFDFGTGGVSEFEILGIDPGLGLDPNNTTAFVTTLTFEGSGTFTGTMTPVTTDVAAVPEPGSLALLVSGLLGLGIFGRRRRKL